MKRVSPRAAALWTLGAAIVLALSVYIPHPWSGVPHPLVAQSSADSLDGDTLRARFAEAGLTRDTLHSGETLSELLLRRGLPGSAVARVLEAATELDARRARAGMPVLVRRAASDSTPTEIVFQLAVDHLLHVTRTGDSSWTSREERLPWRTDTVVVSGTIADNLYQALDDSASRVLPRDARAELAWTLADIYEYRVDMSRELQPGDAFRVLFERRSGPGGIVRIGDVLAARFQLSGSPIEAIRYVSGSGREEYYDATGRSMRAAFLRAPLAFRRISSVFGVRKHPILGVWRAHKGTDYAADAGTPVRAIGDGVVIFAGRRGGYGNCLEIRHRNGMVSRYGHLRGFASGIRRGREVSIGQTVAYVGMTGLATGPHLHFEILVNGVQRNPRTALDRHSGPPIASAERARFDSLRTALLASLDSPNRAAELAMR